MRWLLVALLRGYRAVISPLYGDVCRYYPSCSAYALEAVQVHGSIKGQLAGGAAHRPLPPVGRRRGRPRAPTLPRRAAAAAGPRPDQGA
ncbi:membrane protein insertion efficiency factor YidD [Nocardioides sp. TF02-7]|uniref:membrane protein insertion efficiency factor YidD n=1 Tax=Nocardioides sp. TF02-7 TaxID=2917724 RepID=UPI0023DBEF6B|nr:membrane protein insertion efficiency factor YidD [Nocardioides sp. TF02-7]